MNQYSCKGCGVELTALNMSQDEELKKELDKCSVVDANCHRMITNGLIDNDKLQFLHSQLRGSQAMR